MGEIILSNGKRLILSAPAENLLPDTLFFVMI